MVVETNLELPWYQYELLCQIDSHGLDMGDYTLLLSANGLNGDYRRVSEDDTEFISIIEWLSKYAMHSKHSKLKGGTDNAYITRFTDMTVEQLSNNSTTSLKNVIELRSDLSIRQWISRRQL